MDSGEILDVYPSELKFPFELQKQIGCSLQLSNKTENYVAYKVKTTNPKKYCVRPNTGIVLPRSTCAVLVTMQAQEETPTDMQQCRDKFLVQSVVASPGATPKDITAEMFNKGQGKVQECKLKVSYVAPRELPSLVEEESKEGLFPRVTMENDSEATRMFLDSHDKLPELKSQVSKLMEEKDTAIKRGTKLRQELEMLKRKSTKQGVSVTTFLIIGLLGVVLGYMVKMA